MILGTSPVRYVSVEQAARILRMNTATLYRNMEDVPHIKVGKEFKIPCEFLMLSPPPVNHQTIKAPAQPFYHQPYLPFDVVPERRWRNNGRLAKYDPFGSPR